MKSLLIQLHVRFLPPTVFCDSMSLVMLSRNAVARTKHIELNVYLVGKQVDVEKILVKHVSTHAQITNTLINPPDTIAFQNLCIKRTDI